jgi:glycine betaine catabolism A
MNTQPDVLGGLEPSLPRAAYVSGEVFERERQAMFLREWFCVGREEHIPQRGDYLAVDVAGEPVLVVRAEADEVRAFYSVCRHRGSTLTLDDYTPPGEAWPNGCLGRSIRCPYHSWVYGLDGSLRSAPFLEDTEPVRDQLGLHGIEVATWGGFVFLRLIAEDDGGRSLEQQLGGTPGRVARYPLSDLRVVRRIVYEVRANWKVVAENYNECYHCGSIHPELCKIVPAFKAGGGVDLDWEEGIPHREGAWTFTASGTTTRSPMPGLSEEERSRHKGELVYPNLMLSLSADHVAAFTLWPQAPGLTSVVCDFLFHPDEVERPGFDPSDAVEFWDTVNQQDWKACEAVQRGMGARVFSHGYYAPMEDPSLDVRRYVSARLGGASRTIGADSGSSGGRQT